MNSVIQEALAHIMKSGVDISMSYDEENDAIQYDLNTAMKSYAYLYIHDNSIEIKMRGGQNAVYSITESTTKDDILYFILDNVSGCRWGRDFANEAWLELLAKHNYLTKVTETITKYV